MRHVTVIAGLEDCHLLQVYGRLGRRTMAAAACWLPLHAPAASAAVGRAAPPQSEPPPEQQHGLLLSGRRHGRLSVPCKLWRVHDHLFGSAPAEAVFSAPQRPQPAVLCLHDNCHIGRAPSCITPIYGTQQESVALAVPTLNLQPTLSSLEAASWQLSSCLHRVQIRLARLCGGACPHHDQLLL